MGSPLVVVDDDDDDVFMFCAILRRRAVSVDVRDGALINVMSMSS